MDKSDDKVHCKLMRFAENVVYYTIENIAEVEEQA